MPYLLIVGYSARMATQMARELGLKALAIDVFADLDTRRYALAYRQVASLASADLMPVVDTLIERYGVNNAIYGSGFEYHPESLRCLSLRLNVLGNNAELFIRLQDKAAFFASLDALNIPYPETTFSQPQTGDAWLVKPMQGQGGVGIRRGRQALPGHACYWQQYRRGAAQSVLFFADGGHADIVGFNTQWTRDGFAFSGIVNASRLTNRQKIRVAGWVTALVETWGLVGLNSLDFIRNGTVMSVLEINPRLSASLQLYDATWLGRHIRGGGAQTAGSTVRRPRYTAYQIVYANKDTPIPDAVHWPVGVMDLPSAGAMCRKNHPICSIIAHAETPSQVFYALQSQQRLIFNQLTQVQTMEHTASVNKLSRPLVRVLVEDADKLRLNVQRLDNGCTLIDAGINAPGGLEAGRIITEICLGGMGAVSLTHSAYTENWPLTVNVHASNPVLACLGSQYAGWSLSHEKYYALGSGPARAMATKTKDGQIVPVEDLYNELAYRDKGEQTVLVIENDRLPPVEIVDKVATACGVSPEQLTIVVTPTSSLAGCVQVVGRVLEVAMHKAHALHFPLHDIVDGSGSAPICPPHPDFVQAMGRTNDAILFAGLVHIFVKGSDAAAEQLAHELPSSTSKDYGKPFAQIFKEYQYDFFKIDPMLFSPASVIVTAVESGRSFRAGRLDNELLNLSFEG